MPNPYDFQEIDGLKYVKSEGLNKAARQIDENLATKSTDIAANASDIAAIEPRVNQHGGIVTIGTVNGVVNTSAAFGSATASGTSGWQNVDVLCWLSFTIEEVNAPREGRIKVGINLGGGLTYGQELELEVAGYTTAGGTAIHHRSGNASANISFDGRFYQVGGTNADIRAQNGSLMWLIHAY